MTIAKDCLTDDVVHGNDLRGMDDDYIKKTTFICPYIECQIKAFPCSFTLKNRKQSYFKYREPHKLRCGIHDERLKNKDKSNVGKDKNSPPSPRISLLRLKAYEVSSLEKKKNYVIRKTKMTSLLESILYPLRLLNQLSITIFLI